MKISLLIWLLSSNLAFAQSSGNFEEFNEDMLQKEMNDSAAPAKSAPAPAPSQKSAPRNSGNTSGDNPVSRGRQSKPAAPVQPDPFANLPAQETPAAEPRYPAPQIPVESDLPKASQAKQDENVQLDLGPEEDAHQQGYWRRPPGPAQGGILTVPHPDAARGLIKINKDGSYQYKVPIHEKSQSAGFRIGAETPPNIQGRGDLTYKSMYGAGSILGLVGEYEWTPFKSFGALGLQLGSGFSTAHGNGTLNLPGSPAAEEKYDIYIVPMTAFIVYRFEYVRRQWIVPYINGGGTYYGMLERRDDNKLSVAGAPAIGGGGGIHFSITKIDPANAFVLAREYGVADMWFTLEGRVMQGLNNSTDFTGQMITGGVTVDF